MSIKRGAEGGERMKGGGWRGGRVRTDGGQRQVHVEPLPDRPLHAGHQIMSKDMRINNETRVRVKG